MELVLLIQWSTVIFVFSLYCQVLYIAVLFYQNFKKII